MERKVLGPVGSINKTRTRFVTAQNAQVSKISEQTKTNLDMKLVQLKAKLQTHKGIKIKLKINHLVDLSRERGGPLSRARLD